MPGLLGQPPAVLPLGRRQQPSHELPGGTARLDPPKPARDQGHHSSNSARHRAGSTLWPAATATSSGVHTTPHDHAVAASSPGYIKDHELTLPYWNDLKSGTCQEVSYARIAIMEIGWDGGHLRSALRLARSLYCVTRAR